MRCARSSRWACGMVTVNVLRAGAVLDDPGRVGAAGADRAAGRGRATERRIAERVGVSRPTVILLARPVRAQRDQRGWTTRPRSGRPRTIDHRHDRGRDVEAAAEDVRGDALVVAAAGRPTWGSATPRWPGVAGVRGAAVAVGDVQVLHRPRAGRQGHRRRRAVPGAAGERDRAVRGREVADPGAGPDRSRCCRCSPGCPSDAPTTTSGTAPRRCSPRWRSPPAQVTARVQAAAPPPGVPGVPQAGRPRLPRPASCTW